MKPNMIKKWSIALLVAAGAAGLTGCEGMRIDEGASSATNNGNVNVAPNGATLKANLSGTIVDDFGKAMSGVNVYAYGKTTSSDAGGNWVMNDVPVTGVNINSTPQNLEQTTDLTTSGSIYITYSKAGYAEYRSKINNPAVITHYGTAGGNPNSIIVDNLVASEAVQLPELVNTVTGMVIDKGSYYTAPIGDYAMASSLTVRLVPAVDVVNNAYGSAAQTGAGTTECYEGCGFYSVDEMVATTDSTGTFTFTKVPKIPGGYIMRVDQPGYRPMARPNDGTGFSYDYDDSYEAGLTTQLGENLDAWKVSVQANENQNYWWGIDFDVKTTGTLTYLEELYVGDFLVAAQNVVEGITVGGLYGYPDENSGTTGNDDLHNPNLNPDNSNDNVIDASIVDLGVTPLKLVFSGDMVTQGASTLPVNSIVVFDSNGSQLAWDTTNTSVSGRTLTLQLASTPTANTNIFVRLHKDVFVDMTGQRLTPGADPNQTVFSGAGNSSDPANDAAGRYAEYEIEYVNTLINPPKVDNVSQGSLNLAIPATASLVNTGLDALQASDARIEELYDAILVRTATETQANVDGNTGTVTTAAEDFEGDEAKIQFTAVNGATYRISVQDDNGISLALAAGASEVDVAGGTDPGDMAASIIAGATTGTSFVDFVATVGAGTADSTATITVTNTAPSYKVTIRRINDFGDITADSASDTVTLVDNFEPHVAVQNSNANGQDTLVNGQSHGAAGTVGDFTFGGGVITGANVDSNDTSQMIFACGIERSDDNGEAEVGNEAFYFPKLNLSASLYDKSNNRAHTEAGSLLSTAATAEDMNLALTGALMVNSYNTPLLATTAATESVIGTTSNTSRNDRYYNAADYEAWGLKQVTAAGTACTYYVAELSNVTSGFTGNWYPSSSTGVVTAGATAISDDDSNQTTIPSSLSNYIQNSTYNFTLLDGSIITGNILIENTAATGCNAPATSTYDFDRTVVLNMTEAVTAPTDLAAFKTTAAACGQTNVLAASELDTNLIGVAGPSSGFNNDHMLLTFDDWRTIDDSEHFTSTAQDQVANDLDEGSSTNDLLQIVGITDSNNVAATAGNGRGVLIVDATPPIATHMFHNGSSLVIGFDQTVSIVDNGNKNAVIGGGNAEFEIQGDGADYAFNYNAGHWTVNKSIAYTDRFGGGVALNDEIDITLTPGINVGYDVDGDGTLEAFIPSNTTNSLFTITMVDPDLTAGQSNAAERAVDYSDFFNELSHTTAASVAGTATAPSFFLEYPRLMDTNNNSWELVEQYDRYDGTTGVALTSTPQLIGIDQQAPQLQTVDPATLGGVHDVDGAYLVASPGTLTMVSVHATDETDTDIIYTKDDDGALPGTGATDTELKYVYGYAVTGNAVNRPGNDDIRLVVKLSNGGTAVTVNDAVIDDAVTFIYRTNVESDDTGATDGLSDADAVYNGGTLDAGSFDAAMVNQNNTVGALSGALIIELPNMSADDVSQGDMIVVQNLLIDGHYYSLHIHAPEARDTQAEDATSDEPVATEALLAGTVSHTIYRQVYVDDGAGAATSFADATAFQTDTDITAATASLSDTIIIPFREEIKSVTSVSWTAGEEDEDNTLTDDDVANFIATGSVDSTDNSLVDVSLNALSSVQATNPITEADGDPVGHTAALALTGITDESGNASTLTITLRKGHGATVEAANIGGQAILNIMSGTAIDD
jgi:hypothetical protein